MEKYASNWSKWLSDISNTSEETIFLESETDFKTRSSETILSRSEVRGQNLGVYGKTEPFLKEHF